jgi:2-amino-4-hydroxy-6-hydroxymethyldihydropteridine diphosphokinase
LGSNLGDRAGTLLDGWERLAARCSGSRISRLYESRPLYVTDQPAFLNAVGEAWSTQRPAEMLATLHEIESSLGRDRSRERRMGPRTLDMDILLCGAMVVDTVDLVIPHPRIHERAFVLVPLLELDLEITDPRTGRPLSAALEALDARDGGAGARGVYLYRGG